MKQSKRHELANRLRDFADRVEHGEYTVVDAALARPTQTEPGKFKVRVMNGDEFDALQQARRAAEDTIREDGDDDDGGA